MKVQIWIGKSRIVGKGLFAGQDIKKGTTILRYLGTKISKAQTARELASRVLHEGIIYRHIILTVPALFRTTFYQNAAVVLSAFNKRYRMAGSVRVRRIHST